MRQKRVSSSVDESALKYQGENKQCHIIKEIEATPKREQKNKIKKNNTEDKHYSIGMRPTHSQQQGIYRLV